MYHADHKLKRGWIQEFLQSLIGPPRWCNGFRCAVAAILNCETPLHTNVADQLIRLVWLWAIGLIHFGIALLRRRADILCKLD